MTKHKNLAGEPIVELVMEPDGSVGLYPDGMTHSTVETIAGCMVYERVHHNRGVKVYLPASWTDAQRAELDRVLKTWATVIFNEPQPCPVMGKYWG